MKIAARVRPLYDALQRLAASLNARGVPANVAVHYAYSSHTPASEQSAEWFTLMVNAAPEWRIDLSDRASAEVRGFGKVAEPYVVTLVSERDKRAHGMWPEKTRKAAEGTLLGLVERYRERATRGAAGAPHANPAPTRASLARAAAQVQAATRALR